MGFGKVLLVRLTLSCHGIDIWQLLSRFEVQVHVSVPEPKHSDHLVHRAVPIDIRYGSWPAIRMPTFCPFPFERCQSNLHRATRPAMLATELVTASQSLAFGSRLWWIRFIVFDKFYANNEQSIGIVLTQHVRPFGETMFERFHWIRDRHAFFCFISNQSIDCGAVVLLTNHFDFLLRHVRDVRILFVEILLQRRTFCPFSFVLLFLFAEQTVFTKLQNTIQWLFTYAFSGSRLPIDDRKVNWRCVHWLRWIDTWCRSAKITWSTSWWFGNMCWSTRTIRSISTACQFVNFGTSQINVTCLATNAQRVRIFVCKEIRRN